MKTAVQLGAVVLDFRKYLRLPTAVQVLCCCVYESRRALNAYEQGGGVVSNETNNHFEYTQVTDNSPQQSASLLPPVCV